MNLNQVSPLLSPQQIGELASNLDAIHTRAIKAIQRLQSDIDARKARDCQPLGSPPASDAADKARFAQSRDPWPAVPPRSRTTPPRSSTSC